MQSGILEWFRMERLPRIVPDNELVIDKFISSKLFLPEPPEPHIKVKNMRNIFRVYFSLLFASLLVLLFEVSKFMTQKPHRH